MWFTPCFFFIYIIRAHWITSWIVISIEMYSVIVLNCYHQVSIQLFSELKKVSIQLFRTFSDISLWPIWMIKFWLRIGRLINSEFFLWFWIIFFIKYNDSNLTKTARNKKDHLTLLKKIILIAGFQLHTSPIARGYRKLFRAKIIFAFVARLAIKKDWHF